MTVSIDDIARIKHLAINLQLEVSRLPGALDHKHVTDLKNIIAHLNKLNEQFYEESFKMQMDEFLPLVEVKILLKDIAK